MTDKDKPTPVFFRARYGSVEELIKQILIETHRIDNDGELPETEEDTEEWAEIINSQLSQQIKEYMLESGYSAMLLAEMLDEAFTRCQCSNIEFEDAFLLRFAKQIEIDQIILNKRISE